jgi:hypothetical protein
MNMIINRVQQFMFCCVLFCAINAHAQLTISVSPLKVAGNKAVVQLEMKNNFTEKIESARAAVFLLDEQGKMVGESTKWVVGGTKDRPPLEPKISASAWLPAATGRR